MWPTILSCAVTLAIAALGFAIAWGRLNKGQESIVEAMKEMAGEFKKLPEVYVTVAVDRERQRLSDERHLSTKELLVEIKQDVKDLKTKGPNS